MHHLVLFLQQLTMSLFGIGLLFIWISGFVIAKGVWSTIFCIIPFYAWYLVVEKILTSFGIN